MQRIIERGIVKKDQIVTIYKSKTFPTTVSLQDWHTLVTQTKGDEISVSIDGKPIGSFKSSGITHDHKTLVSLTTNRVDVNYDDFSLKAAGAAPKK